MKFVALINATRGEPGRKRSSQLKRAGWLQGAISGMARSRELTGHEPDDLLSGTTVRERPARAFPTMLGPGPRSKAPDSGRD
jgi:hypothetical protein